MGQARNRGTFSQRQAQAIARNAPQTSPEAITGVKTGKIVMIEDAPKPVALMPHNDGVMVLARALSRLSRK